MRNLILIRHGKSEHYNSFNDVDRDLTAGGQQDAKNVATQFQKVIPSDAVVYSSSAKRASHTAKILAEQLRITADIDYRDELYTFFGSELEQIIRTFSYDVNSIIIFGHNGAITEFVNKFGDIYIPNVPTAGLVWLEFEATDWKTIHKGRTIKKIFPRDLR